VVRNLQRNLSEGYVLASQVLPRFDGFLLPLRLDLRRGSFSPDNLTGWGTAVFELSSAQVNEAINAFKRLGTVNMSLTEAVDFAIKHSRPDAGVISVEEAIQKALETKRSKRPSYVEDLRKRWGRFREWLPAAKRKAINTIVRQMFAGT